MQGIILGEQSLSIPIASANQSPTKRFTVCAKITCFQLELHVAPSDGKVYILSNDSREFSGILDFDPEALDR